MKVKQANAQKTLELLKLAIAKNEETVSVLKDSKNPQVVKIREELKGQISFIEDVIESLGGNHTNLKILLGD